MGDAAPNANVEEIPEEECWQLLAQDEIGRLGVARSFYPAIVPVNYALDGRSIVIRTDPGMKLDAANHNQLVCFEIDAFDRDARTGWDVVVAGALEVPADLYGPERARHVEAAAVRPWAGGEKAAYVRVVPHAVTGRRIRPRR